jgi:hypothetical protein
MTEMLAEGALLQNAFHIARTYWPYLISAMVMGLGAACCGVMLWKERGNRAMTFFLILVPAYALLSHAPIVMVNYYVLPSAFAVLTGLAYVIVRGWRHNPSPASAMRAPR